MKWRGRRTSDNVTDLRRGGGGRVRTGGRVGGIGIVLVLLAGLVFGVDLTPLLGLGGGGLVPGEASLSPRGPNTIDDAGEEFVAVVLADTEAVWQAEFARLGGTYEPPQLVLFSGAVRSACGTASSAVGPFYCPGDRQVYLDLDFFRTMESELGARGEFARAYVIAHEVGHHVQNLTGVMDDTAAARARTDEAGANAISVRVELQADCLAGVWARAAQERFGILEPGDIESAMDAAARIGDDALQRRGRGYVVPDSFTHGTSAQRQHWFSAGFESGRLESCDTFAVPRP
jgi:predicted metalloprotease